MSDSIEIITTTAGDTVEVVTQGPQGAQGATGPTGPAGSTTYGTTAGTACEGNDARIATIGTGTGSLPLGASGTRTTLNGSASGSNKTLTLPNATGTLALSPAETIYNITATSSDSPQQIDLYEVGAETEVRTVLRNTTGIVYVVVNLPAETFYIYPKFLFAGNVYGAGDITNIQLVRDGDIIFPASGSGWEELDANETLEVVWNGSSYGLNPTASYMQRITLPNATGTVALTSQATDIEITDSTKGYILNSATKRWRITIDDNGVLLRTALALIFSLSFMCGSHAQVRDLVYGTNNVVVGPTNTNALTFTNRVTLPIASGAATTNSLLTADGAGGSSFVASKTVARILTNDYSKTNWGNTTFSAVTNAEAAFGTWSLDANSTYKMEWSVGYTYSTNVVGPVHGVVFSGNIYLQTNSAVGWASVPAGGGLVQIVPSTLQAADLSAGTNATGTRFRTGTIFVPTGTNAITAQFHWCPNSSNSNTLTLLKGSTVSFTKIAP